MADNILPFPRKPANDNYFEPRPTDGARVRMPSAPDAATIIASAYQCLGGMLSICSRGQRGYGRPCYFGGRQIPQLPFAQLHQQFHSPQEYEGAMKLLETLMHNFDKGDTDFIFDAFAHAAVGEVA